MPPSSIVSGTSTDYERMEAALDSPRISRRVLRSGGVLLLLGLSVGAALIAPEAIADRAMGIIQLKSAPVPHTGEWCMGSGAKTYTKTTLKTIADRPIAGLLTYEAGSTESKFEASDVIRVGESFLSICDSSWSILKVSDSLPVLSHENRLIKHDASFVPPEGEDSGFEAIMHDASGSGEDYYVVRESVPTVHLSGVHYDAQILKVQFNGDGTYRVEESCHSEFKFEGESKGFEGAVSLRGKDGVLYILGLCEGNHCSEAHGKEAGNGRVVVMAREDKAGAPGGCHWRTVRTLELPPSVRFVDYSALAVHHSTQAVAVTSQENSQLWIGSLSGGSDGDFDPAEAAFAGEGKVYDFPRTSGACEVQYCNVEGIHWVSGGKDGGKEGSSPQMLVAVSDKMKSKGRQPASCFDKDQSVHLFSLP